MATSGTRTFIMTRDQIVTDALSKINAIGLGDTPTTAMLAEAQLVLNMMVQHWQNYHIFLWTASEATLTIESGTATYYLSSQILEVKNVFFRNADGTDTICESITRESYEALSDKSQTGLPNKVFIDYQITGPSLTFWPVYDADDATAGYSQVVRLQDFSSPLDNPDFPARWYKALCLGLAVDLSPTWGRLSTQAFAALGAMAESAREQAKAGGGERSDMRFKVRMR
jgi:hypothetical protein